ncbi:MAG TPA: fibronectin type III domain-containing protein [Chitinophagales bacterium]|nr:fibronectin type III domain-containing protein [Chitinophagales bacterium]HRK28384.1 fibronectin type III domain-containing protein [Chitinophagales bacterium]
MSKFKASRSFATLSDALLITFTEGILTSMNGNTNYLTPTPTLATLTTQKTEFEDALAAAIDGGKILTATKNQKRATLIDSLYLLVSYVELTALGDEIKLLSSGFEVYNTEKNPRPLPAVPIILRLSDGDLSGEMKVKVQPVESATGYQARYSQDDFGIDTRWQLTGASTSTTILLKDLLPGKYTWVQVRSFNSQGNSEWSDPARLMTR